MRILILYNKIISCVILFIFSLVILSLHIPARAQEIQVTTDLENQYGPDIWEDYIVYSDNRDSNKNYVEFYPTKSIILKITR